MRRYDFTTGKVLSASVFKAFSSSGDPVMVKCKLNTFRGDQFVELDVLSHLSHFSDISSVEWSGFVQDVETNVKY